MIPKFRAFARECYFMSEKINPIKMYHNVSVVRTFHDNELHVIADFGMYNEEEYNGTELIDFVLMQSTGLFDKNGVEIFEDDVVKFQCTMAEHGTDESELMVVKRNTVIDASKWEIIGNRWENPELMKATS